MKHQRSLNIYLIIYDLLVDIILCKNILMLLNTFQFLPKLIILHRFHYYHYYLKVRNGIFYLEVKKIHMAKLFIQVIREDLLIQARKIYVIYWKISLKFLG